MRFYHLTARPLEQALPQILTKALAGGHRIVVRTANERDTARLNELLWTFRPDSFLPHGATGDGYENAQPVLLTDKDENPNGAGMLVLTGSTDSAHLGDYKLCCALFDGRDETAVSQARAQWKACKEAGHEIAYWQQDERGGWTQKA